MGPAVSNPSVLVVEDDPAIGILLLRAARDVGYSATLVASGEDCLALCFARLPFAILLDRRLPDCDGLMVARKLRERNVRSPILMVTGAATVTDELDGFAAGVDDYIKKPFDVEILMARLKVAARHAEHIGNTGVITVGELSLDIIASRVTCGGTRLALSPIEFRLLHPLMASAGRIVDLDYLAQHVWGHVSRIETGTYRAHMRRLRRKLLACAPNQVINTVRGAGYCLAPATTSRRVAQFRGPFVS
jgi:DNA-binding response OmpR family regulator